MSTTKPRERLTAKQEAFCVNYLTLRNATQSAIKAGYPVKTAQQISSENLSKPVIQERLAELEANKPPDPDIADVEERRHLLTKIARHKTEKPVTAGHITTAIDTLNKLDRLYVEGGQGDTNIQINIYSSIPRPEYKVKEIER